MKKVVSVALSFMLLFAFVPMLALADLEADGEGFALPVNDSGYEPDAGQAGASAEDATTGTELGDGSGVEGLGSEADSPDALALSGQGEAEGTTAVDGARGELVAQSKRYDFDYGRWALYEDYDDDENNLHGVVITEIGVPTTYTGPHGENYLTIPSVIDGKPVVGIGRDAEHPCATPNLSYTDMVIIPESVRFVYGLYFNSQKDGVFFEGASPVTELYPRMFHQYQGSTVKLPAALTAIPAEMFLQSEIESIELPGAVRSIGRQAFEASSNLTSVTLNEGLQTIGEAAFAHMPGSGYYYGDFPHIKSIAIPNSVVSIDKFAFRKVTTLSSVSFGTSPQDSHLDTIRDRAFFGNNLTSVVIPDSVTSIGAEAFSGTNEFGGLDGEGEGRHVLASLQLGSSQSASSLQSLGSKAFAGQPITSVVLPNSLTSFGYDASTFEFRADYAEWTPYLVGTLGAFSKCTELHDVTWPVSPTFVTVGGFDGCTSLPGSVVSSLPSSVKRIDDYAFYDCTAIDNAVVPATVESIGKGAFSKAGNDTSSGKTFTLMNKDIRLEWTEGDVSSGPWPLGCGYTIKYPRSAAADSSIVTYRDAVEDYEEAQGVAEANRTKFETVADAFYQVTGTVPEGATVKLIAGDKEIHPTIDSNSSFTPELVEGGAYVGAVVSLDGYLDYQISPVENKAVARIDRDWNFTVTEGQMTPLSNAGMIQVSGRGAYRAECNIAVFTSEGKLVSQGGALRVSQHPTAETTPIYIVDAVPEGNYTVVAWQKNDYFSRISSLGDFADMGFTASDEAQGIVGDYARADVAVPAGGVGSVTLDIPPLDTSKISGILATGDVYAMSSYTPPEVPFTLIVNYETTTGQSVDSVQVSIPTGMVPLAAALGENDYSDAVEAWAAPIAGEAASTLTIGGLADADKQSGTIAVSLKANEAGTYAVGASLQSGGITAPLGVATVECPDIKLVVPKGTLSSREFDVHVYARPNSEITLKIGETELSVGDKTLSAPCKTNLIGHAKVTVKIPDEELSSTYYHEVTATTKVSNEDVSDSALVQYAAYLDGVPIEPTIYNFSFDSAGDTYDLVKDGKDLSGGYYIFGVHEDNFTREMPFTVQIDSLQPLENGAMLYLGMLDDSVQAYDMNLSDSVELSNGAKRYTYSVIVPISDGGEVVSNMVPCRFDVATKPLVATSPTAKPQLTEANINVLLKGINDDAWALSEAGRRSFERFCADNPDFVDLISGQAVLDWAKGGGWDTPQAEENLDMLSDGGYDWALGVFNNSFRHEKWYTEAEWNALDEGKREWLLECESETVAAFDYLAGLLGNSKPMYEYASFNEYVAEEYGYTYSGSTMPTDLENLGYTVVYDTSGNLKQPASEYDNAWYNKETGKIEWPEPTSSGKAWIAANLPRLESASDPDADELALTSQQADPRGSDDVDAVSSYGSDLHYIIANMPRRHSKAQADMNAVGGNVFTLYGIGYTDQVGKDALLVRGLASAASVITTAKDAEINFQGYTETANELATREDELNRMKWMYEMHVNNGVKDAKCADALKQEMEYLNVHISDLRRKSAIQGVTGFVGTLSGEVAAGAGLAAETLEGAAIATAAASGGTATPVAAKLEAESKLCGTISLGATAVSVANAGGAMVVDALLAPSEARHKTDFENYRYYREWECKKTDFGKLHYNKKPIIDPSGYTYEGVEGNRISDVIATIYQKVADTGTDADWEVWDAEAADQVNPQLTNSAGLFAWDVPPGLWKVLFQKEGYLDAWSRELRVPPPALDVAINMLRADPPEGTGAALNADDPDAPYVDITFSQYMKAAAGFMPTVTVGGVPVTDASWVNVTAGTDEAGNEAALSLTLRVPLAGLVEPGEAAEVAVAGAYSYAGRQMAAPYTATVTIPDDATYYYVAPDDTALYRKGSGEALSFTFKRTARDKVTFERFEGVIVDGKAVGASDYSAAAGSVVVTLKASYLESLPEGGHALTARFADGSATAAFAVVGAETKAAPAANSNAPATGDAVQARLLLAAALVSALALAVSWRKRQPAAAGKHARK